MTRAFQRGALTFRPDCGSQPIRSRIALGRRSGTYESTSLIRWHRISLTSLDGQLGRGRHPPVPPLGEPADSRRTRQGPQTDANPPAALAQTALPAWATRRRLSGSLLKSMVATSAASGRAAGLILPGRKRPGEPLLTAIDSGPVTPCRESRRNSVSRTECPHVDQKRLTVGLDRIALAEFTEALRHNLKDLDLIALSDLLAEESSDRRQAQKEWTGERPIPKDPYWSER